MAEPSLSGKHIIGGQISNTSQSSNERESNLDSQHGGVNIKQSADEAHARDAGKPISSRHSPVPGRFTNPHRPVPEYSSQPILDPTGPAVKTPQLYHDPQMMSLREITNQHTHLHDINHPLKCESSFGAACEGNQPREEASIDPRDRSLFDQRWINHPEQMWDTGTRRSSSMTISPQATSADEDNIFRHTLISRAERVRYFESLTARAWARNQRKRENLAVVGSAKENDSIARPLSSSQRDSGINDLVPSLSEQRLDDNSYSAGTPWTNGRDSRRLRASDQSLVDSRGDIGLAHGDLEPNIEETSHNPRGTTDNLAGITDKLAGIADNIESTTDNLECVRDYLGRTTDSSAGIADGFNSTTAGRRDTMAFPTSSKQVLDELFQNVG
ncbi:MAG: hypothetical protein Q9187_008089, partial [Circinaria calcarea]